MCVSGGKADRDFSLQVFAILCHNGGEGAQSGNASPHFFSQPCGLIHSLSRQARVADHLFGSDPVEVFHPLNRIA